MSVLFNEKEADADVIETLLKIIRRLTPMALLQLKDGSVVRVEKYEVVTTEEVQAALAKAQAKVTELESFVAAPVDVPAPAVDTTVAPVVEPTPVVDPATTAVAPEVTTTPVDTTTAPTEPPVLQ